MTYIQLLQEFIENKYYISERSMAHNNLAIASHTIYAVRAVLMTVYTKAQLTELIAKLEGLDYFSKQELQGIKEFSDFIADKDISL